MICVAITPGYSMPLCRVLTVLLEPNSTQLYSDIMTAYTYPSRLFVPWLCSWLNHTQPLSVPQFRQLFSHVPTTLDFGIICVPPDLWIRAPELLFSRSPMQNSEQRLVSYTDTMAMHTMCADVPFTQSALAAMNAQWLAKGKAETGNVVLSAAEREMMSRWQTAGHDDRKLSFRECLYSLLQKMHAKSSVAGMSVCCACALVHVCVRTHALDGGD
jgi:hypothetical protein